MMLPTAQQLLLSGPLRAESVNNWDPACTLKATNTDIPVLKRKLEKIGVKSKKLGSSLAIMQTIRSLKYGMRDCKTCPYTSTDFN